MKKNTLMRDLKGFIDTKESRPVLSCLHFDKDGSITATDSHVLVHVSNWHHLNKDFNLNLLYMTEDTSRYPDISRIMAADAGVVEYTIAGAGLAEVVQWVKGNKAGGKDNPIKITLDNEIMKFSSAVSSITVAGTLDSGSHMEETLADPKYLYNVLNILNDAAEGKDVKLTWWSALHAIRMCYADMTTQLAVLRP